MSSERHLRRALEALSDAAREHLARHPLGHLMSGSQSELELTLPVPLAGATGAKTPRRAGVGDRALAEAHRQLVGELEAALARHAAFRPGRVLCLRCAPAECEHGAPRSPREVFAGYGPSGTPRFLDFGQWLLERQHPEVERIYRRPPELVTDVASGRELSRQLLPAFRDRQNDYRVHGQVAAGWFPIRAAETSDRETSDRGPRSAPAETASADDAPGVLALTFQILSSAVREGRRRGQRRLALNVLGSGFGGQPLESLHDRLDRIPWTSPALWGQSVLASIEQSQGDPSVTPELLSRRVEGVLTSIARRLEQERRSRDRRTGHAQRRHREGDRPTRMALEDLARAGSEAILVDERRQTTVVLGGRGRAHVWNAAGKLVTSIRYSPESIERKKKQGVWRPARREEIMGLRKITGVEAGEPEDPVEAGAV